jgi:hypothetical protein
MRTHRAPGPVFALGLLMLTMPSVYADQVASVVATVRVTSRTSLTVSTSMLRFQVTDPSQPARATVEFDAGARVADRGEIVLTVEAIEPLHGPGGPFDGDGALTFSGAGDGTVSGALTTAPVQAARWHGSGHRRGVLTFEFRAAAPGEYLVPVHFVLSAP